MYKQGYTNSSLEYVQSGGMYNTFSMRVLRIMERNDEAR